MSFLMLALLVVFASATVLVLADSAMRLWSVMGGFKAQHTATVHGQAELPSLRGRSAGRVSTRVSYALAGTPLLAEQRAAA